MGRVHLEAAVHQSAGGDGQGEGGGRGEHNEHHAHDGVERVRLQVGPERRQRPHVLAVQPLARRSLECLLEELAGAWPAGGGRGAVVADHARATRSTPVMAAPVLT